MVTREDAERAVRGVLEQLMVAGRVPLKQLNDAAREDYVRHVCSLAALAIATMPAVQEALAIIRPELTAPERYTDMVRAIVREFGYQPDQPEAKRYLDPAAAKALVN